jgi:two-component system nitrate/nitrite response regulator NarL
MPDPERIRLLIVDDHTAFVESLCALLGRQPDLEILAPAPDAESALRRVAEERPHVILMDQELPGMSGAHATGRILERVPGTAVVMLTGGASEDDMLTAVESGICGYLEKTARVGEILEAIRHAAAGEMLLPPDTLGRLLSRVRERRGLEDERRRRLEALAPRERETLGLIARGLDTKAIAAELGVSVNTARGYVQHVIEAFGAHSRLEAVVRAQELGIISA